jgi:hypothetical protein
MKKNFKSPYETLGGTYREKNGYLIPDIALSKQTDYQIGKYGQLIPIAWMRREKSYRILCFFMYSFNHFKKLQYFAKKLESIVAKRRCL